MKIHEMNRLIAPLLVLASASLAPPIAAGRPRRRRPASHSLLRVRNNSPAAVNNVLTQYAQGLVQDQSANELASFVSPWVVTGVAQGQYKKYDDKQQFSVVETRRPLGVGRNEITFDATDPPFLCLTHGLQIGLDDYELEQAGLNASNAFPIKQAKVNQLVNTAIRSREKKVWDAVKGAVTATGGLGGWSSDSVDPIDQIDAQIEAIWSATGKMPNRIAMGLSAWVVIRKHAKVKSRKSGVNSTGLALGEFASMLLNPAIEVRIGTIPYDTAPRGTAKSTANVIGGEVFVFYAQDNPDTMDASFCKTFSPTGNGVSAVKEFRHEDIITKMAVDWTETVIVTSPICGNRITLS
ncbi:MAG: hypothetical protein V4726_07295 [Verrucomicrobiota bacterium]